LGLADEILRRGYRSRSIPDPFKENAVNSPEA
jgi:hypothetical protein